MQAAEQYGVTILIEPDGWCIIDSEGIGHAIIRDLAKCYSGSAHHLAFVKNRKQRELDQECGTHNFGEFVREQSSMVTESDVAKFWTRIANNYLHIRAQIAQATDVAMVEAIDVTRGWKGWPHND